jgi:signal transduction histidine kinase
LTVEKDVETLPRTTGRAALPAFSTIRLRYHAGVISEKLKSYWLGLSLAQQFLAMAFVPISCNTVVLGIWMSYQVSMKFINGNAAATALYIDSFIDPLLEELKHGNELTPASIAALDRLAATPPFSERVTWIKLWNSQGKILYSSDPGIQGQVFPLTSSLARAFTGEIVPKYNILEHNDNTVSTANAALLQLYVPIWLEGNNRVVAVAELFQIADKLSKDLTSIQIETWILVSGLSLWMTALLFGIVRRGSDTIEHQSRRLTKQVVRLSSALDKVRSLNALLDEARQRSVTSTERYIRRIGSDLHDGPAQEVGLALLLVEKLNTGDASEGKKYAQKIDELLSGALQDLRSIAAGLTTPELESLSVEDALLLAAEKHEWKTGTVVTTSILSTPEDVPSLVKISLFRFVQEGLSNAFKHAGGKDQTLHARYSGNIFVVEVTDSGAGLSPTFGPATRPKLGLAIMRDRIESLNGTFEIESRVGGGTLVRASFRIPPDTDHYGTR